MIPKKIRLLNWLLDCCISIGLFILIIRIFFHSGLSRDWETTVDILLILFNFLYYLFFESLFGKSPAKFLTKTQVVYENGCAANFKTIFVRSITRYIPLEPFFILFSEEKLGLHDTLSNTKTIYNSINHNPKHSK